MDTLSGQLLIVEDEPNIRAGLRDTLAKNGHSIMAVGSGEEALAALNAKTFDAAVVDIRMPGMSGIELLRKIRTQRRHLAVIILTGHGDLESAMAALKAGAHDYLLKPARPQKIRQAVHEAIAACRRRRKQAHLINTLRANLAGLDNDLTTETSSSAVSSTASRFLNIGKLHIDFQAHEVSRDGRPIHLSPTEFKLLATLAIHRNEVMDYITLTQLSLGYEAAPHEAKELIKRHVFTLRHKIEPDPTAPSYLLNVRGVGYRLTSPS